MPGGRPKKELTLTDDERKTLAEWAKLRDELAAGTYKSDAWLRVGGLKGFVDGSLGSHTAAMFEPFEDTPNNRGLFVTPPEKL